MARLITEGWECGDAYSADNVPNAAVTVTTEQVRSGAYALKISGSGVSTWQKNFTASNEVYMRVAIHDSLANDGSYGRIKLYSDATLIFDLRLASNVIVVYRGTTSVATGTIPIYANTWHLLEIRLKVADVGGIIQVTVDGILDIDFTGDTKPSTQTTVNSLYLQEGSATTYYDDLALNDTTGGSDNSWCGDGHIIALKPNGNGDKSEWTGSDSNQTDNYLLVDEIPNDGDTTYVASATVGHTDLYNLEACGLTGATINRVWAEGRARDTVAAGGEIALVVKTGGTEYAGGTVSLLTSYTKQILGTVHTTNPQTTVAWTASDLDSLQIGPKVL